MAYQAIAVVQKDRIIYKLLPQFTFVQFKLGDVGFDAFYARENYTLNINGDGEAIVACEALSIECLLDTIFAALLTFNVAMLKETPENAATLAGVIYTLPQQQNENLITEYVSW